MSTDLSRLATAAGKWEEMAAKFKTLEDHYKKDVHGVSLGESWIGLSAQAAQDRFAVTLKELQGARREAKAVAAILRDAHTQLTDLRNRVKAIRDGAVDAGMRVSDQGTISFDSERLTQAERTAYSHDPDFQQTARVRADEWAGKLVQAVGAVSDADDGIRLALDAAVLDSDPMDGTFNGFNRNPGPNRYPSLEEAGKAANMPEDRKDVPSWWRTLDPVTRSILLQEKGDELRAAGIMDPRYEWRSPDPGSGPFDVEEPTPRDVRFHAWALGLATVGDITGQTGASRNMLHYLRGTGDVLDLDVNRMLHDDPSFRSGVANIHIAQNQEKWRGEALAAFEKAGGDKPVTVPVESKQFGGTFGMDTDWYRAVGSYQQNLSGMVTVRPGEGGRPEVSLEYQVNVWDRYNWDPSKQTPFPGGIVVKDKDMGHLHTVGIAQEFDMRGSSSTYTHDLTGDAGTTVKPDDPGRDGGRGDVSRGEEENR
ncbi:hypothetical protein OG357_27090 [Streptomyces sp. NBC_01255]|uniref:hypothetical protein n=1 Tax=Streptomyces sp. NBC_01255 TaxID=2903798 RepID=UPI002E36ECE5|nr:hypothetical protein [Streptomyces sp. NBC_01255]